MLLLCQDVKYLLVSKQLCGTSSQGTWYSRMHSSIALCSPPALPSQQMAKENCGPLRTRCIAEAPNSAACLVEITALSHHSDSVNGL